MAAPSCISSTISKSFATKVVDKLSDEQIEKFGITDDPKREDAIKAIQALVEFYIGAEADFDKREQMLQDVDGFISDLENHFTVVPVSEDELEEAQKKYNTFLEKLTKEGLEGLGRLSNIQVDESPEMQNAALRLEAILQSYGDIVTCYKETYPNSNKVKSISFILREPVKIDGETAQQKTLKTINTIQGIPSKYIRPEKDSSGQKTGRSYYDYNGKRILVESVSHNVHGDEEYDGPVLASHIGTHVDSVGRLVFDKESNLWKEGKLVNDEKLQEIINDDLRGIFTVKGLKNLINDFLTLENQLKEKWGSDIQIFSGDLKLFAKQPDSDVWIYGKPDLLVIDGRGIVHVLDFKTSAMHDIKGYNSVFHDEREEKYHTGEYYGKQISRYIRLLESYGMKVDNQPYVILIDTWYDGTDTVRSRNEGNQGTYAIEDNAIGLLDDEGNLTITLGEYAAQNPTTREEVLDPVENMDREILYMEPRLHIGYKTGVGFTDELAALRGEEDIPFDSEVTYEQQWTAMTEEEKEAMKWLNAQPVVVKTAQGIVTLSSNDIESKPELISSQEIQNVANYLMYEVSDIITKLQRGETFKEFPLSEPIGQTGNSAVKGKSRADIIRQIGIDNLINKAFKRIQDRYKEDFPSEQDWKDGNYDDLEYEFQDEHDYQEQKRMNNKAKWLIDHKEQLIMAGYAKLMALENSIIPVKNKSQDFNSKTPAMRLTVTDAPIEDTGDNESNQTFADMYLEGITDIEAWMLGQRHYSPKASLAQEIKRMFEDITLLDAKGKPIKDAYGWGFSMTLDATQAIQTILDTCKNCETIEEMLTAMRNLARSPQNLWVNQVLDMINTPGNENLKKKFFRHFRKDNLNYSIAQVKFDKKTGKRVVETRIVNTKSAYDTITQSLGASFRNGQVGSYFIGGNTMSLVSRDASGKPTLTKFGSSTVAAQIRKDISTWQKRLEQIYKSYVAQRDGDNKSAYVAKLLQEKTYDGKTIIQGLTEILNGVGIMVPQDVVLNTCLAKVGKGHITSNAGKLLNNAKQVINKLETLNTTKGIPEGLAGNSSFRNYQPMLAMVSDSVQEFVEASVYQDGKTYYSYTNPSRLGHIVRNLKDSLGDPDKFEKYLKDQFGRYTGWFMDVEGKEYLCDWIKQFANSSEARQALQHKVELSYIGNHYKNLGALGFQLSILHNYFGSRDDQTTDKDYRWFALPTMSNKPTNEFLRMLKYKDNEAIIDRVLMPTFQQEMNRIADVLFHYTHHTVATDQIDLTDKKLRKAGWTNEEIQGLKDRINSHNITANDVIRLSAITSGAKFHFLWYLNNTIAQDKNLAAMITDNINQLLTPDSDEKTVNGAFQDDVLKAVRKAITTNMEQIVEQELEEMKKIGLFDVEIKKVNGKEVKTLRYQEEFGGNLGNSDSGIDNATAEMEAALREFIWQDIAANINIIQITGGDLAYYGNAVNYQKRIAQVHSPGLHLMHDADYDDGYLRSVHISDEMVRDEIKPNTEVALTEYMNKMGLTGAERSDYQKMINIILSGLTDVEATDGQSYSSPTSIRKKLALQGEWDDNKEKAYKAIIKGDFNINHLGIMLQPSKPFVTSDMAKYSGSTTMELRKTPLQDKNSEYLIVLAEAIARGTGKRSKLVAVSDFMEKTHTFGHGKSGIDTVHFASVNKVGKSGVIDLGAFDKQFEQLLKEDKVSEDDYNKMLSEYMLNHIRRKTDSPSVQENFDVEDELVRQGKLKREEAIYNNEYVDTIPVEDYIIQQEVPAHLLEHEQLYGSQIRILGISDITPGTTFNVNGEMMSDEALVNEYKELHAQNIRESFNDLMEELGLDKLNKNGEISFETIDQLSSDERNQVYKNLEFLLQKELSKDAKYGLDMRRACALQYDADGNVIDFNVPLMDPIQSKRIQMLINSIIKKSINKQRITGGPVVQTTAYDQNLHIRFKDKNGNILMTFNEYGRKMAENSAETLSHDQVLAQYKEYLRVNQAGIAYFECYMPIPNAELERLMTNPDGSMMSFEELKKKLPKDVFDSMMQVIGYRIPTEDKYSMLPLKIMGFVPKAAGQVIMMPQEITYLTGSDFDIDKMYIMMKAFQINYDNSKRDEKGRDDINAYINQYKDKTGNSTFPGIQKVVQQVITNAKEILNGNSDYNWTTGITRDEHYEKALQFIDWYKEQILKTTFSEYIYDTEEIEDAKKKGLKLNKRDLRKARDNRLLDLQWAVLTNADTTSKMLNPGNFNDQKKVGRIIRILKNGAADINTGEIYTYNDLVKMDIDELDELLENSNPHNTTLPSSKIYFQRQNMQGSQMVGIFANNNVSHAFMTFQKVGINLYKGQYDNTFSFDGVTIGDPDNPTVLDPQRGFNGQLISKTIASFLAASVDTAKDPVLSDLNVNTFTGGVAMVLARLGFDTASIGLFLSQPVIIKLSDLFFKNRTDGFYDGDTAIQELASQLGMKKKELMDTEGIQDETLSKENFIEHLNDTDYDGEGDNFQKRVLKGFYNLFRIARDLQELTFCTKFNSVNNAVGPTIADTMEDLDRVNRFLASMETNVFYVPDTDNDPMGFTDPAEVITNDPILQAFFETTVDSNGASEKIFKSFFPHYFNGFQNMKQYFQENFMGGKKLSSKLFNQLLDEYLYYLMTYQDANYRATLPSSWQDKERLVGGLVKDFQAVLKIQGRKPNPILDQSIGGSCLRVRTADEFLAKDILIFNGSQLNADGQQKIKNAWSDLITMDDPNLSKEDNERIRRFGVDLFFYTLMRNGFGFSPRTLMHLASVIVRYNARYATEFNSYINGLRGLKEIDEFLMNGDDMQTNIRKFCSQFIRNHANNHQLVPNIDFQDKTLLSIDTEEETIEFGSPIDEEYKLSRIMLGEDNPYGFITITRKNGKQLTQELYELV